MKRVIGIDTGGTYTDAVLYDLDSKKILCTAKAPTTREDLTVGIGRALGGLASAYFDGVSLVSLSTTLATNACVENKGGRAKLLFLGVEKKVLDWVGAEYGLLDDGAIHCMEEDNPGGRKRPVDYDALIRATGEWLHNTDGLGIVEMDAVKNGAEIEKAAKRKFAEKYDFPIVCGYELFSGLNSLRRGSSTLLNAKLVPVVREFLDAVRRVLDALRIDAPAVVIRSDGTMMSEQFARLRPVETILCGPAASVLGGVRLTNEENSVIVDMGGTTTDVSLVRKGRPVLVSGGVAIGSWQTFVKGVLIDTFGLGGDSAVVLGENGIKLETRRVLPMCAAAARFSSILPDLENLLASGRMHEKLPLHEFLYLVKDAPTAGYSEKELRLCRALRKKPLLLADAAEAAGADAYTMDTEKLEREGIVMRCGLTPTDFMHLKGDFTRFDARASTLAARYLERSLCAHREEPCGLPALADTVYDLVKKKLYCNLVRVLMKERYPSMDEGARLEWLIEEGWQQSKPGQGGGGIGFAFSTDSVLVGIGAPVHIFLPDVAAALHTTCVVPGHAGVANAIGAAVAGVSAIAEIEIKPVHTDEGTGGYLVFGRDRSTSVENLDEAIALAAREAADAAKEEARRRGVMGAVEVVTAVHPHTAALRGGLEIDLGTTVTAEASGKIVTPEEKKDGSRM